MKLIDAMTVGQLLTLLRGVDPSLPISITMNQEYQEPLRMSGVWITCDYVEFSDEVDVD